MNKKDFLLGICVGILLVCVCFFIINHFHKCDLTDQKMPHSPYLMERDTIDDGFSGGWMPHFLPSEEYWIDTHVHLRGVVDADGLKHLLDEWFARLDAYRLGKIVAIIEDEKLFEALGEAVVKDPRIAWMYWPKINEPSLLLVQEAVRNGACALKLHNTPVMKGLAPRTVWQNDEWQKIFSYAESIGIPLLWHVTQRHGYSPYHGGGLYADWQEGWERGVTFTNEDLLQDMLAQMRHFPKLKVIGAHQLHVGLKRQQQLLREYENLYIESSCGMYLRWADDFIEEDRVVLRDFIENWSERLMFGTDAVMKPGSLDDYAVQSFLCHVRFMLKLSMSDQALQDVAWRTANRLFDLKPVSSARRGNVRP